LASGTAILEKNCPEPKSASSKPLSRGRYAMVNFTPFIPDILSKAPFDFLAAQLPNLRFRRHQIGSYQQFATWSLRVGAALLSKEAEVLRFDYQRVEAICARLVWLMGATYSDNSHDDPWYGLHTHDWQRVMAYAQRCGFRPEVGAIDLVYAPELLSPVIDANQQQTGWRFTPTCWEVVFLHLQPGDGLVSSEVLPLSVLISTGRPVTKLMEDRFPAPAMPRPATLAEAALGVNERLASVDLKTH